METDDNITIIDRLGDRGYRIFVAELSESKRELILTEACDMYFTVSLNKDQVIALANEFMVIAAAMVSSKEGGN